MRRGALFANAYNKNHTLLFANANPYSRVYGMSGLPRRLGVLMKTNYSNPPLTIVIDSREQRPLVFPDNIQTVRQKLLTADYSALGIEHLFAVERKSIPDLVQSCTHQRERFEQELHRLRGFRFKRLLIVGSRQDLLDGKYFSRAKPQAITATLSAFEVRYDLPVVWVDTPAEGGRTVAVWAWWFAREIIKNATALNREGIK